jgi:acetolactate synthase small subunit
MSEVKKKIMITSIKEKNDTLVLKQDNDIISVSKILSNDKRLRMLKEFDGKTLLSRVADNINTSLSNAVNQLKSLIDVIRLVNIKTTEVVGVRVYDKRFRYILIDLE